MMRWLLPLVVILAGAIILRVWDLDRLPNGLHWDEMDTGYQAYSLLTTGRDYFGNRLPLLPHSLADWRTPVYLYSAVPFVAAGGLSATTVRAVSVVWGVVGILLIFVLTRDWWAPLVFALSPWHLVYSRKAVETISLTGLFLLGLACFSRGLRQPRWLVLAGTSFGLAVAAYSPGKLFVPLFVLVLVWSYWQKLRLVGVRYLVWAMVAFGIITSPILLDGMFGQSGTRFRDVAVFSDPTRAFQIDLARLEMALSSGVPHQVGLQPRLVDKLMHNKPLDMAVTVSSNYLESFSTDFLFIRGDPELRHSPNKNAIGQLHMVEVVALAIGLWVLFRRRFSGAWLWGWILLAPVPAALTREGGNHAARLLILFPALAWVIGLGIRWLWDNHKAGFALYMVGLAVSSFTTLGYFFTHYRWESAPPYQWGFGPMVAKAIAMSADYDRVILDFGPDSPLMAYLFTTKFDPAAFQKRYPLRTTVLADGVEGWQFGKIYLLPSGSRAWGDIAARKQLPGRTLVVASSEVSSATQVPASQTVLFPNELKAFYVFEVVN